MSALEGTDWWLGESPPPHKRREFYVLHSIFGGPQKKSSTDYLKLFMVSVKASVVLVSQMTLSAH